jgi:hypothetical protein
MDAEDNSSHDLVHAPRIRRIMPVIGDGKFAVAKGGFRGLELKSCKCHQSLVVKGRPTRSPLRRLHTRPEGKS